MQLFYLKHQLQNHFDGALIGNKENVASIIPTPTHPECLLLHGVTLFERIQSPVRIV